MTQLLSHFIIVLDWNLHLTVGGFPIQQAELLGRPLLWLSAWQTNFTSSFPEMRRGWRRKPESVSLCCSGLEVVKAQANTEIKWEGGCFWRHNERLWAQKGNVVCGCVTCRMTDLLIVVITSERWFSVCWDFLLCFVSTLLRTLSPCDLSDPRVTTHL